MITGPAGDGHNRADPFPVSTRPGTSIVAVCMNRHDTLRRTLPTWRRVRNVSEIVIVDWSSSPLLYSSVIEPVLLSSSSSSASSSSDQVHHPLNSAQVRVVRVDDENTWVLTRAYNLAMSAASYDTVIRTDCDYALSSDFITAHPIPSVEASAAMGNESLFYAGNYASARDANEAHLNGAVVIRRADFFAIGGYDERIQTYGWDDEDLYGRLQHESNLTKRNVSFDHVGHVRHADAARAGAQRDVEFVQVEIDLNSLLLKPLGRWNASHGLDAMRQWTLQTPSQLNAHHTSSSSSKSSSNSLTSSSHNDNIVLPPDYVAVSAEHSGLRPKPLKALVSQHDYNEAWKLALGQRLANDFQMPWDIMETMPADARKLLLSRLNARLSRRRTAALEQYQKQHLAAGVNSTAAAIVVAAVPPPRLLFVHCMHGLGNRLRALASAMSFANATDRELVVIWEKDAHIAAYFDDLFVAGDSLVVMSHFKPKWPFAGYDKWDRAWTNFRFYNYMEMEGNGAVKGAKIVDEPDKHIYFKSAYIMHVSASSLASLHPRYHQLPEHLLAKEKEDQASSKTTTTSTTTTNWDRDNTMLRSLTPVPGVVSAVRAHAAKGLQHMVGIHIRDRTLSRDIRNVDFGSEYGPSASTEMQYWREKSSYRNFIAEMWRMVEREPDLKFYIATDTVALFETLNREFPDRLVYTPRACDGRDGACIRYALIDLLCLAQTKELVGSNWSSFTEAASRFGGKKPRLSGVDFAKELPHAKVQTQAQT